jgi:hypothetical protein
MLSARRISLADACAYIVTTLALVSRPRRERAAQASSAPRAPSGQLGVARP